MSDVDTMLMNAGISTSGVAIVLIVYRVLKSIQGKRFVSSCCGRRGEIGFDVGTMTPPPAIVIHNPRGVPRKEDLSDVPKTDERTPDLIREAK